VRVGPPGGVSIDALMFSRRECSDVMPIAPYRAAIKLRNFAGKSAGSHGTFNSHVDVGKGRHEVDPLGQKRLWLHSL